MVSKTPETNSQLHADSGDGLRYQHLYHTVPHGVIHQAADGAIVSANPAAERILGITIDQMQGLTSMDARWHMEDEHGNPVDGRDHPAMIALRTGQTVGPVVRSVLSTGTNTRTWLRVTAVPFFRNAEDKEPPEVYAFFEDITALRTSEEQYRNLINHLPGITYRFSNTRGGLFWSDQINHILGFSPEQIISDPFLWNNSIHPDDRQIVQDAIVSHAAGAEYCIEYRIQTATGAWIWLHDCFVRKTVQDNEVIIDGFAVDITRRKNSEAETTRLLTEKDTLLREIRHRVKNNMSIITSLLSLQLNTATDTAVQSALNDTMSRLTSLQLLFDELHTGPSQSTVTIQDYLRRLVDHTVRLFGFETRVGIEYALEDCTFEVKQLSSLGLIVNELLTNAMKYAFQDNPDPRLTVTGTRSGENYVLTIADNGPGMLASVPAAESTGLGMTIVRALSEQIGARIQFEDAGGVRVRLELPLSPSES